MFAHYLGNGPVADACRAALRIPNVLRNLLGEGTLSASFIPVYAALEARGDRAAAKAVAGAVLGLLLATAGGLALVGIAFAPALTTAVAAGFDEPTRRLTITLVRLLFPMTGLMVVSAWCLGVLNTHQRFFLPYAAPALWNIAGIAALVAVGSWIAGRGLPIDVQLHHLALGLAWGTVTGSVLQVAVQLPACWRLLGGHVPLQPTLVPPGVRDVLRAWTPLVIGAGVGQISSLIDTQLGSFAGPGGVASLGYAQLVQQLPVGLFGVSVAAVALPALSRDALGQEAAAALRTRLAQGFRRITFFVVPSAFVFVALGERIVATLFQTGRFHEGDAALVGSVLAAYGIGLLGMGTLKLFSSGFFALRDTRTPVRIGIISLVVSTGLAILLVRPLGAVGIALGSSVGVTVNVVLQLTLLERRIGAVLDRDAWTVFARTLAGGLLATALAVAAAPRLDRFGTVPGGLGALTLFGAAYLVVMFLLRHPDARRLWPFPR